MSSIKSDLMLTWLHEQQCSNNWIQHGPGQGIVLKRYRGEYLCLPKALEHDESRLFEIVKAMNVAVSRLPTLCDPMFS